MQSFSEHIVFEQNTFPISLLVLLSYQQSGVNVLYIVISLKCFTFVCNVISVLVEVVDFAMVKLYNLFKYKYLSCSSNFLME